MTTTSQFQTTPDYYSSIDECKESKRKKDTQTNPRYREYKQTHFTAGDENQFQEYRDMSNREVCIPNINLENNKFSKVDFSNILKWEKYNNISALSVDNTFNYLFNKFKKGTFVKIQNNELKVFLPFSKKNFVNEWGGKIKVDPIFKGNNFNSSMSNFVQYINKLTGKTYKVSVNSFTDNWYSNNCLVRYEYPINEGDTNVSNFSDMLKTLCATRKIPDIEFFINRRDFPQLKRNGTEAYNHIFGDNHPLLSHNYTEYSPILSMVTTKDHADIPIPTGEDWARISSQESKFFTECREYPTPEAFSVEWKNRKPTAVFRGASTGCGVTVDTNIRLKLAYISVNTPPDKEGPLLDAGISKWNLRPRKLDGEIYLKTIDVVEMNKMGIKIASFMTPIEQSGYKYLVHVDGHVSAFRLSLEICMGCCILLAESKYKLWFRDMLKPMVHYIPVKEDLSDLIDQIKWCRANDKKCEKIAIKARKFYMKYLRKEGILDYMQKLLIDLKNQTGVYMYNTKTPLQIQISRETELYTKNYPVTEKKVSDIKKIPKQSRSIGLLKGLEWIVNMTNDLSSFCTVAEKDERVFSNATKTTFVDKYKLSGFTFVVKSTKDPIKISENIHEIFIGTKVINEVIKYVPNFAYVFGTCNSDNNVIMEYINGKTFSDWLTKSFNMKDFIFILIQLCLALEVAQRQCGFVHYDLKPWNIIIKELPHSVSFDYMLDEKNVYRINTQIVPVIIDYGKSHVIYENIHYGFINMFKMSTIQDVISILITSLYDISETIDKKDVADLLKLANFISGTNYRKTQFRQTGPKGVSDFQFFAKRAKKYNEMISSDKYELDTKTPLDFINYVMKNFLYKFQLEKIDYPIFRLNRGNPRQVFDYILASTTEEKIQSFIKVFDKAMSCDFPPTEDSVLLYYTAQTLEGNLTSLWNTMLQFLETEKINPVSYEKKYKSVLNKIKNSYSERLKEILPIEFPTDNESYFKNLEIAQYTQETFLIPNLILKFIDKYTNSLTLKTDLYDYKHIIENVILNQGEFKLSDDIRNQYKKIFKKLLDINCVNMKANTANAVTLLNVSHSVYTNDKLFITKSMSEKENEKFNDCLSINKYMTDCDKILNITTKKVQESKKNINMEGDTSDENVEEEGDISDENIGEEKELEKTDSITITFGDQAENHAGMQQIGKARKDGFTVDELKHIQKEMKKRKIKCELIKLNDALDGELKEESEEARVLIIRGLLDSEDMSADLLFHQLKTIKWDSYLIGRNKKIQNKHARSNICFSEPSDIPGYSKEEEIKHKNSKYWQDETLSYIYKKQQQHIIDSRDKKAKLPEEEIYSVKGSVVKWETFSVLNKFKKYIEKNFGEHAQDLVAEGNSYTNINKCGIGYHGDTERKIVIGIRLGKSFPMHFQWYHRKKKIGKNIILPQLNHGDVYIMSEKAVGSDWRKSSKITLRHAAGCPEYVNFEEE